MILFDKNVNMESISSQDELEKKTMEKQRLLDEERVLRDSSGTNLEDGILSVNTVRLGDGCRQNCIHCGSYDQGSGKWDLIANAVTSERMERILNQEFLVKSSPDEEEASSKEGNEKTETEAETKEISGYVKKRMIDLFANYVTTDINQEPLDSDAFLQFSKLVKKLSGGESRVVCVSHGVTKKGEKSSSEQVRRLREIVDFMEEYDVFVLSLDFSRMGGKIDYKTNLDSYATTINELRPAIESGVHVTVSIQGNDEKDSPYNRTRALNFYDKVKRRLEQEFGWDPRLFHHIVVETERAWVNKGRAKLLPGVDPDGQCPVIPDERFVYNHLKSATMGGYLDMITGGLYMHPYNAHRTYNDVLAISRKLCGRAKRPSKCSWEKVEHGFTLPNLSYVFSQKGKRELFDVKRRLVRLLRMDPEKEDEEEKTAGTMAAQASEEIEQALYECSQAVEAFVGDPMESDLMDMFEVAVGAQGGKGLFLKDKDLKDEANKKILKSIFGVPEREEDTEYLKRVGLWNKLEEISSKDKSKRDSAEQFLALRLGESKTRGDSDDVEMLKVCADKLRETVIIALATKEREVWGIARRLLKVIEQSTDFVEAVLVEALDKRKGALEENIGEESGREGLKRQYFTREELDIATPPTNKGVNLAEELKALEDSEREGEE